MTSGGYGDFDTMYIDNLACNAAAGYTKHQPYDPATYALPRNNMAQIERSLERTKSFPRLSTELHSEMEKILNRYIDNCTTVYKWIQTKEIMKNTNRFSVWSLCTSRNNQGVGHGSIAYTEEFVDSVSQLFLDLNMYCSLIAPLMDSCATDEKNRMALLTQFEWIGNNDALLDKISSSMDNAKISRKMSSTNRDNIKKTISECKQVLFRIRTYVDVIRRGGIHNQ